MREIIKVVAFSLVFLIFLMTILMTIFVLLNNADLLGLTPQKQQPPIILHLTYPPLTTFAREKVDVSTGKEVALNTPLLTVDLALQYTGPLVEGTQVDVLGGGHVYPEGRKIIRSIEFGKGFGNEGTFPYFADVGFQGATVYDFSISSFPSPEGEFSINLETTKDRIFIPIWNSSNPWPYYQSIKWDLQGDYHPILAVTFLNGTTFTAVYDEKTIHVGGADVLRQEKYAKISTWLTIALFILTIVTSAELLYKLRPTAVSNILGLEEDDQINKNGNVPEQSRIPTSENSKNHNRDKRTKFKSK